MVSEPETGFKVLKVDQSDRHDLVGIVKKFSSAHLVLHQLGTYTVIYISPKDEELKNLAIQLVIAVFPKATKSGRGKFAQFLISGLLKDIEMKLLEKINEKE